jgi:UDP-N-acetylglucosamine--N-acetylmuramyl-(pentapeptide) pyrophosphoryl-undecaprenol N-acetylglucosamine transferase
MSQRANSPVMILAGGTGGHIYPALAVAQRLISMNIPIVWMGTRRGLEAQLVPKAGIAIDWLSVSGLRGKGMLAWLFAPVRLNVAIAQALIIMLRQKPAVVLGMGGFVAGPGGIAAFLLNRPLVIHEQNAIAGLTNRLLVPLCNRLLEGFPNTFKTQKACYVGNPVRTNILALADPQQRISQRKGPLRLLVLGGSLGAQALNEIVPETITQLSEEWRPQLWHQAGPRNIQDAERRYKKLNLQVRLEAYIDDMASAYAWADLVLCRAGALTVAELCAAGLGALLVPYPYAVDDHQSVNAGFMVEAGAGVLIPQTDLTAQRLVTLLTQFGADRDRLTKMAIAARRLAKVDASDVVARICLDVAKRSHCPSDKDEN